MSDDGNVVSLPVGDARRKHNQRESEIAELPIGRAQFTAGICRHAHSVVDARARTVKCDSCGVPIDPIDLLDRIAHEFATPLRKVQEAERRVRDMQENIGRLEREERNAKARVRTARKQALKFDAAAVEAALVDEYSAARYGTRDFHSLSEHQQDHARQHVSRLIEAYIGALDSDEAAA